MFLKSIYKSVPLKGLWHAHLSNEAAPALITTFIISTISAER